MVKSRAEICRDYRRRLKERDDEGYLKKERERRRRNYVPSSLLAKSERNVRRRKNRIAVAACRAKKKLIQEQLSNNNESENLNTSGYESMASSSNASTSNNEQLIVAMNFPGRAAGPRRRLARDLYRANRELKNLRIKHEEITKRLKSEQKRRQRVLKRLQKSPKTPNSKAEAIMKKANLSEVQKKMVRKELVFNNTITEQIRAKRNETNKRSVHSVHQILAGNIIRKYKCQQALCYRSGLNKNTLSKYSKSKKMEKTPFKRKFEKKVLAFFERDDNSRVQPGKADVTKYESAICQTRVLTDYLENLHQKFLAENAIVMFLWQHSVA